MRPSLCNQSVNYLVGVCALLRSREWKRGRGGGRGERARGERTGPGRNSHADIGVHEHLSPRGHDRVLRGVDVVAGCEVAAASGQPAFVGELLDEEGWGRLDPGDGRG